MITKADKIRFAIATCELWFVVMEKDMWTPNELVEELWFRVEQQLENAEEAEHRNDEAEVHYCCERILRLLNRIEEEMLQQKSHL